MQILINIPEEAYKQITEFGFLENTHGKICYKAIKNGTPIYNNMTNGDVLISLYPNLKYTIQNGRVVTTVGVASSFDLDWWNAPYKGDSNEIS